MSFNQVSAQDEQKIGKKELFFLNGKYIIINNRSLHKTNRGRGKQNYKTKAPYINETPMKKTKTITI
jgi:hypothetical protein